MQWRGSRCRGKGETAHPKSGSWVVPSPLIEGSLQPTVGF
jgi:hypothetical protein